MLSVVGCLWFAVHCVFSAELRSPCWMLGLGRNRMTDPDPYPRRWSMGCGDRTAAVYRTSLLTLHVFFLHSSPVCLPIFPHLAPTTETWSGGYRTHASNYLPPFYLHLSFFPPSFSKSLLSLPVTHGLCLDSLGEEDQAWGNNSNWERRIKGGRRWGRRVTGGFGVLGAGRKVE